MRTREVWLHAVDLGNGGSFTDFPADLVDRLLPDVEANWRRRGVGDLLLLQPTDRAVPAQPDPDATEVRGTAAQLARWATGRGGDITTSTGGVVQPFRWL